MKAIMRFSLPLLTALTLSGAAAAVTLPGQMVTSPGQAKAVPAPASRAASGVAPEAAATAAPVGVQSRDYSANLASDIFGAELFTGSFAQQGASQFNPDYIVAVGDQLQVRLWGGFELDSLFVVDPQGNIFLPHVGPVNVLGVRNQELQAAVDRAVRKVFSANVYSYASLAAAQPVRVFVSGNVNRPGLYNGTSMDSLLHYLDLAGGIDLDRGSFLNIEVKRSGVSRAKINLYEFLLEGKIPLVQFADGDVIFVLPKNSSAKVGGLVRNAKRFEFEGEGIPLSALAALAKPSSVATHVRVMRNSGATRDVDYYTVKDAGDVIVNGGDDVEFTADRKPGTITVRVEGETIGAQEFVLPYGSRLGELLKQVRYSEFANAGNIQLFRISVKTRQKALIETSLRSLESTTLTARSGTSDEAQLRTEEANMILQWIDRARQVEPTGQVYIAGSSPRDQLILENGDILRIPAQDSLVLVNGEVLFPNAVAYDPDANLKDYIRRAGGFSQRADVARVVIAHADGSYEGVKQRPWLFGSGPRNVSLRPGDEILVLPKIDVKSRQVAKDVTQILYQLAISAKVIFDL